MIQRKRNLFAWIALTCLISTSAWAAKGDDQQQPRDRDRDSGSSSPLIGPSLHLAVGIRSKKAPDLDTYYSTVGGVKLSLFGLQAGNAMYLSFLAPGLQYAGYGIFAPSITPVMINHNFGIGFGFDFFTVRSDRKGGPLGMSLNLDVIRIASVVAGMVH